MKGESKMTGRIRKREREGTNVRRGKENGERRKEGFGR